jgi:hypothetical protein
MASSGLLYEKTLDQTYLNNLKAGMSLIIHL